LGDDFSLDADANACGLVKGTSGDLVTLSAALLSPPPKGVITRRKPVKLSVTCAYNRKTQDSAAAIQPITIEILGDLSQIGATIDVSLNLLDDAGAIVKTGDSLAIPVGEPVFASVTGKHLVALGLKAVATDCWVTSKEDPADPTRWNLLQGNCVAPEEDTFSIAADGAGQVMSFEAFSFTSDVTSVLYLHCKIETCMAGNTACGTCASSRRRRSLSHYKKGRVMTQAIKVL
jgi:hypothetical protein